MGHSHHHHHIDPEAGDRRVALAVLANLGLTVAQVAGGLLAGSLALIADALHNFSDAVSLIIAFLARRIARRPADRAMTFGYGRAEVVAALVNYTTLIVIGLYLLVEAAGRFADPEPVTGWLMIAVAGVALAVDLATAALTFRLSKTSMNIRAAFLHNLADAMGSAAVIVSGALIMLYDWRLADPIATVLIAGYILWHALSEIGGAIRILMLGSPEGADIDALAEAFRGVDGVADIHHIHLWRLQEDMTALDAHVVLEAGRWGEADAIKGRLKALVAERFSVRHATLELECARHACADARLVGHG